VKVKNVKQEFIRFTRYVKAGEGSSVIFVLMPYLW